MSDVTPTGGDNGADAQTRRSRRRPRSTTGSAEEKARRQAWLQGPDGRGAARRTRDASGTGSSPTPSTRASTASTRASAAACDYGREGQLATEGAVSLLYTVVAARSTRSWSRPGASGRRRRRCRAVARPRPARRRGRLTDAWPSRHTAASTGSPASGPTARMRTLFRHPRRVGHVAGRVLRACSSRPRLQASRAPTTRPGPIRLRLALERLGGAWVKLGQMLAMRPDLLPVAYCDELVKLLNRVEPFGYDEVRDVVRERARRVARGGLRVLRADLVRGGLDRTGPSERPSTPGERVAVKVQRPRIRQALEADIDLMYSVRRSSPRPVAALWSNTESPPSSTSSRAGPRMSSTTWSRRARRSLLYDHARGGAGRARRTGPSRIHHIARAHDRAHRGRPASSTSSSPSGKRETRRTDALEAERQLESPDRPSPRLEHAQPGLRVRGRSMPTSTRPTSSSFPATSSATSTSASSATSRSNSVDR